MVYSYQNNIGCLSSFSPSDARFATCSDDGTIKIWNFHEGIEERTLTGKQHLNFCFVSIHMVLKSRLSLTLLRS